MFSSPEAAWLNRELLKPSLLTQLSRLLHQNDLPSLRVDVECLAYVRSFRLVDGVHDPRIVTLVVVRRKHLQKVSDC